MFAKPLGRAAVVKAISSLESGMAGGFLQTSSASVVRRLSVEMELSNADREVLSSYLSAQRNGYAPQSGEITGILKEMKDTMEADLASMTSTEESSKANFQALVSAKEKEIAANTKAIEEKTVRSGEVAVEIVNMKEDLDDTQKSLVENTAFLKDLEGKGWAAQCRHQCSEAEPRRCGSCTCKGTGTSGKGGCRFLQQVVGISNKHRRDGQSHRCHGERCVRLLANFHGERALNNFGQHGPRTRRSGCRR